MNKGHQDDVMKSMYEIGQERANRELEKLKSDIEGIREESEALGILKKINYDLSHNEMLKYAVLYKIKKEKDHKQAGMTWEAFCNSIGEPRRTVDRILTEIKPVIDKFSANLANLIGMPLSKIRYLGNSVSANLASFDGEAIIFEGRKIPITPENAEDIEALIEAIQETHKKEKEEILKKHDREIKKQESNSKDEIEHLEMEKDALTKENKRLKVFDIADKLIEWNLDQVKELHDAAMTFAVCCSKFIVDERLRDDLPMQSKVMLTMNYARDAILDLQEAWDERMNPPRDIIP